MAFAWGVCSEIRRDGAQQANADCQRQETQHVKCKLAHKNL